MISLLLAVIYLAFISLGLPDAILGSAWPNMYRSLNSTITGAGSIFLIISVCTIISSLNADRVIHKFSTARVTAVSVGLTALSLFGFSFCQEYWQLCLWAIPYGLGAGAVDSALNNYVALHFSSKHLSWLHCMWGVGASIGPYIMGMILSSGYDWPVGYRIIGIIQVILTTIIFISLPLWTAKEQGMKLEYNRDILSISQALKLKGAPQILLCFFGYCALEQTTGLWAASWLNVVKDIPAETATSFASIFYVGITGGRAISGFIAEKLEDKNMIRLGFIVIFIGLILLTFSFHYTIALIGLATVGFGCAPIYPSIIHSTPERFGRENSQSLIGIQMASAYIGSAFMPKLFGILSDVTNISVYPFYLLFFLFLMFIMHEWAENH